MRAVHKLCHPLKGEGRSTKRSHYSINLFSTMCDKRKGGINNLKKWVMSFMDSSIASQFLFLRISQDTNLSSRKTQQLSQYTQKTQLLIFLAVFLLLINLTQAEMIKMKRHTSFCCSSTQLL